MQQFSLKECNLIKLKNDFLLFFLYLFPLLNSKAMKGGYQPLEDLEKSGRNRIMTISKTRTLNRKRKKDWKLVHVCASIEVNGVN